MKLYSASQERPVRLCETTRNFAFASLEGRWGDESLQTPAVSVDFCAEWDTLSDIARYEVALDTIVREAPVRICPGERIVGAATLGAAVGHVVPAYRGGQTIWSSISHVTLGFDRAVQLGMNQLEAEIDARIESGDLTGDELAVEQSMKHVIEAMRIWHGRYLEAAKAVSDELYQNLRNVPFLPPSSFHEAVQSLWFCFAFTRLCGNWPGIGRIDDILGVYLKRDLDAGVLDIDEAREILAHFFIKGCEWIRSDTPAGSGDAQHYQNIVLGGIDADGKDVTNEVTYLVLDIVEELAISDFPITVRLSEQTSAKLLRRTAEVIRYGGGIVAVYNEPLIIESMTAFGYSLEEARRFANDGCWEVQVPGKTYFMYGPFDSLQILLNTTLGIGGQHHTYDSFDELYRAFSQHLRAHIERQYQDTVNSRLTEEPSKFGVPGRDWSWKRNMPCPVVSLFTEGCVQSGRYYLAGGPVYTVYSPHIGGAPDTANSLLAIQKLVYEEKKVTLERLLEILENNWEGEEALRQYVRTHYQYYGNDSEEADQMAAHVLDDFGDMVNALNGRSPILFPAGVSTFGRQIDWMPSRCATPFGYRRGEILSGNDSPTPGTDTEGATAEIRSYCRADLRKQTCGAALDVRLHPSAVKGEDGVQALIALLRGFVRLGGFFMQIDSADAAVLRDAQEHPENYKSLSVRVSGWNARFVTLNREWQRMIIERTEQQM